MIYIRILDSRVRCARARITRISILPLSHWLGLVGGCCDASIDHIRGLDHVRELLSLVCLLVFEVITSREGGAFVLDDFLKYIVHDCLRVVGRCLLGHAQNVAALLDVVFDVIVGTLVGQLSHLDFLARELLVQIEQVQARRWQLLQTWREHSRLQSRHRRFKLRWNQSQWLVLHTKRLV